MRRVAKVAICIVFAALSLSLASCGGECQIPPCMVQFAIRIWVTAASGGPVAGVTVVVAGTIGGTASCSVVGNATECIFPGPGGTYELEISVPKFQAVHRSVTVRETSHECGCSHVETEQLYVTLAPSP
jgi:hypothetical protein